MGHSRIHTIISWPATVFTGRRTTDVRMQLVRLAEISIAVRAHPAHKVGRNHNKLFTRKKQREVAPYFGRDREKTRWIISDHTKKKKERNESSHEIKINNYGVTRVWLAGARYRYCAVGMMESRKNYRRRPIIAVHLLAIFAQRVVRALRGELRNGTRKFPKVSSRTSTWFLSEIREMKKLGKRCFLILF